MHAWAGAGRFSRWESSAPSPSCCTRPSWAPTANCTGACARYGTIVFFGFTYVAQLILVYRAQAMLGNTSLVKAKVALCAFMLMEGLALEAFIYFVDNDAWLENLTEWHVATALSFYPFVTWLMWRKSGFVVDFRGTRQR